MFGSNLVFSLGEKTLKAVLMFLSLGLIARYLGPEVYGQLNYVLAICTIFQIVSAFGLEQSLIRELTGSETEETLNQVFSFKLSVSLIGYALFVFYLFYCLELNLKNLILGTIIFSPVLDNARIYYEYRNRHKLVAQVEMISQIISALLKIAVATFSLGVVYIYVLFAADFIIPKIVLNLKIRSEINYPALDLDKAKCLYFLKLGSYHLLGAISVFLYMKIDQLMIGGILGMTDLGNYSSAVRLSDAWYFIPITVTAIFFPMVLKIERGAFNVYLQAIFDLNTLISLLAVGFCLVLGEKAFFMLFGNSFSLDFVTLILLFLSGVFVSFGLSTGAWLHLYKLDQFIFLRTFAGAILNIILNFILIPIYGIKGCAIATLISYGSVTLSLVFVKNSGEVYMYLLRSFNLKASVVRSLGLIKRN